MKGRKIMDDKKITLLLKNSSQDGLVMLIKQYRGYAGAIISRILPGYEEDIAECIEDTFIAVWNHREKLDPSRNTLKGLVAYIARNKAINRYNKLSREQTVYLEDEELAADIDVSAQLETKHDIQTVQSLISYMTEPDREIFIRRHFLAQAIKDIAAVFNLDEKQIKNRLYQSRLRLKEQLIERGVSI